MHFLIRSEYFQFSVAAGRGGGTLLKVLLSLAAQPCGS